MSHEHELCFWRTVVPPYRLVSNTLAKSGLSPLPPVISVCGELLALNSGVFFSVVVGADPMKIEAVRRYGGTTF